MACRSWSAGSWRGCAIVGSSAWAKLNRAIGQLLAELNQRPFKRLPGCRRSAFAALDAPALKPLPAQPMVLAQFEPARVTIDYHVAFEGHYYSVPHQHVGAAVELRITASTLEVLLRRLRIAAHARSSAVGGFTTVAEHMPASHREHRQWTPAKFIAWGDRIGAATAGVVRWQMERRTHPEQGYRSCLGLMRLAREFGAERLEAACARAQSIRAALPQRQVDPGVRPGPAGHGAAGRCRYANAQPRQGARARLLRPPLMSGATNTPATHSTDGSTMLHQHTPDQLRGRLRLDGMIAALNDPATRPPPRRWPSSTA